MLKFREVGLGLDRGWKRDLPDFRDYHPEHPAVSAVLTKSKTFVGAGINRAASVDLSSWCSPVENQGDLGSCTANAAAGLVEWFQRKAFGKHVDMSRLFLYKVIRDLLGVTGDTGGYLRTAMQALVMFGAPPEKNWPYVISKFDQEPSAFLYALAENYKALKYYRLTPVKGVTQLDTLLNTLAGGMPFMFGFTVYSSISNNALIPFPGPKDTVEGGHAIMAVGYDDPKKALKIRNSWGTGWGEKGYGWLPYDYVTKGLADDFWSLVQADFVDTDLFK